MLLKAHLTSHSRLSGSRWVTTSSWSFGSITFFFFYCSVHFCHLFSVSSASIRSLPFLFFIVPIFAWNVPLAYPIFLKRSLVFPIILFSSISLHCSLRKAFLALLSILWNSAISWVYLSLPPLPFGFFFSQLFVKPPQTTTSPSCISFSLGWFWSLPPI